MENRLTEEQINQLFAFTQKHLVEYYDVQVELVDHLANAIEEQWNENPTISFNEALDNEYKKFGIFGFTSLVEQKQAALQSRYWKLIKVELIDFVSIPKAILTGIFFYGLFQFFKNTSEFQQDMWLILKITLLIFTIGLWLYQNRMFKKSKSKFLLHSISNYFYSLPFTLFGLLNINISNKHPNLAALLFDTVIIALYILFFVILFTKIIPLLKNEIKQTEQKFQMV
ncbi:MAG TPA: hypothetical protein VLY87_05545 [Flavobacterium sp.]|nr:hypothetical protein [Flavobacterium sp.]